MKRLIIALSLGLTLCFGTVSQTKADWVAFSSITPILSGYYAFAPGDGTLGAEDYIGVGQGGVLGGPPSSLSLTSMRFVGGVDTVGGILDFTFFDAAATPVSGFAVALPAAGNFIWSIGLGGGIPIETSGFLQVDLDPTRPENAGVLGQWFIIEGPAGGAVSVGTSPQDLVGAGTGPNGGQFQFAFELTVVPEPTTFALFGLVIGGGLMRRRR